MHLSEKSNTLLRLLVLCLMEAPSREIESLWFDSWVEHVDYIPRIENGNLLHNELGTGIRLQTLFTKTRKSYF